MWFRWARKGAATTRLGASMLFLLGLDFVGTSKAGSRAERNGENSPCGSRRRFPPFRPSVVRTVRAEPDAVGHFGVRLRRVTRSRVGFIPPLRTKQGARSETVPPVG